jgi:hypothetical protein
MDSGSWSFSAEYNSSIAIQTFLQIRIEFAQQVGFFCGPEYKGPQRWSPPAKRSQCLLIPSRLLRRSRAQIQEMKVHEEGEHGGKAETQRTEYKTRKEIVAKHLIRRKAMQSSPQCLEGSLESPFDHRVPRRVRKAVHPQVEKTEEVTQRCVRVRQLADGLCETLHIESDRSIWCLASWHTLRCTTLDSGF